jgi:hypothetical protein
MELRMAGALIGAVFVCVVTVGFIVWLVLGEAPPRETSGGPPPRSAPAAPR